MICSHDPGAGAVRLAIGWVCVRRLTQRPPDMGVSVAPIAMPAAAIGSRITVLGEEHEPGVARIIAWMIGVEAVQLREFASGCGLYDLAAVRCLHLLQRVGGGWQCTANPVVIF